MNRAINESGDALGAGDQMDVGTAPPKIAALTGGTISFTDSGMANLYVGGHALVAGLEQRNMTVGVDANNEQTVLIETGSGHLDVTSIVGGEIGGLSLRKRKQAGTSRISTPLRQTFRQRSTRSTTPVLISTERLAETCSPQPRALKPAAWSSRRRSTTMLS